MLRIVRYGHVIILRIGTNFCMLGRIPKVVEKFSSVRIGGHASWNDIARTCAERYVMMVAWQRVKERL